MADDEDIRAIALRAWKSEVAAKGAAIAAWAYARLALDRIIETWVGIRGDKGGEGDQGPDGPEGDNAYDIHSTTTINGAGYSINAHDTYTEWRTWIDQYLKGSDAPAFDEADYVKVTESGDQSVQGGFQVRGTLAAGPDDSDVSKIKFCNSDGNIYLSAKWDNTESKSVLRIGSNGDDTDARVMIDGDTVNAGRVVGTFPYTRIPRANLLQGYMGVANGDRLIITPESFRGSINNRLASPSQIEAGTNSVKIMNPAGVKDAIRHRSVSEQHQWFNKTNDREEQITYTNDTDSPIRVYVYSKYGYLDVWVDNPNISFGRRKWDQSSGPNGGVAVAVWVPPGQEYRAITWSKDAYSQYDNSFELYTGKWLEYRVP